MPSAYFDAAFEVARFLDDHRIETDHGTMWQRCVESPDAGGHSLYHGSAGILLFHLELHRTTGDVRYLDVATSAGREIVSFLDNRKGLSVAVATGWPGYAMVLTELADATGDDAFRAAAARCLEQLRSQAAELGSGIGWIEPMPFSDITGHKGDREIYDQSVGAAGAGLVLLQAHRRDVHPEALVWAQAVADRLLDVAEYDADGLRWKLMSDMPFPFTAPNFAHGGAGVGYFLADMHRQTGEVRYLDAAIEAARYVRSRATPTGDGLLVCHTEEADPPIFYLGACHGPAGTGRLFMLLSAITGDESWLTTTHSLTTGLLATGAPEVRSVGLWNNNSQCCGDAGIGDYALFLNRTAGDSASLDLATRCADELLRLRVAAGAARAWPQAEHRVRPRFVETQTGYMQGAAGIGSFLLHFATSVQGDPVKIPLADMPVLSRAGG